MTDLISPPFEPAGNSNYILRSSSGPTILDGLNEAQLVISNQYEDIEITVPDTISAYMSLKVDEDGMIEATHFQFRTDLAERNRLNLHSGGDGKGEISGTAQGKGNIFFSPRHQRRLSMRPARLSFAILLHPFRQPVAAQSIDRIPIPDTAFYGTARFRRFWFGSCRSIRQVWGDSIRQSAGDGELSRRQLRQELGYRPRPSGDGVGFPAAPMTLLAISLRTMFSALPSVRDQPLGSPTAISAMVPDI